MENGLAHFFPSGHDVLMVFAGGSFQLSLGVMVGLKGESGPLGILLLCLMYMLPIQKKGSGWLIIRKQNNLTLKNRRMTREQKQLKREPEHQCKTETPLNGISYQLCSVNTCPNRKLLQS